MLHLKPKNLLTHLLLIILSLNYTFSFILIYKICILDNLIKIIHTHTSVTISAMSYHETYLKKKLRY